MPGSCSSSSISEPQRWSPSPCGSAALHPSPQPSCCVKSAFRCRLLQTPDSGLLVNPAVLGEAAVPPQIISVPLQRKEPIHETNRVRRLEGRKPFCFFPVTKAARAESAPGRKEGGSSRMQPFLRAGWQQGMDGLPESGQHSVFMGTSGSLATAAGLQPHSWLESISGMCFSGWFAFFVCVFFNFGLVV